MVRPPQTARSERTREALRQAALVRFLAQGVEATSAEQIAEDAGVSLRTFYRHFRSKHDLLFADYDAGLHWFRAALDARPADESIIDSVQAAIFSFPYDVDAVTKIASLRRGELEPSRIVRHMREVEADFADAIQAQLRRRNCDIAGAPDARLHIAVTARCVAAAVFGAMEAWMLGSDRSLGELARVCHVALESLRVGISDTWTTLTVFVIIDKTSSACEPALLETRMTGYDAIVIGAGHNGLTAAVLLQRAGLRTACLDAKRYAGGMASTVELFDGYRFEIAGSVQFPNLLGGQQRVRPGQLADGRSGGDVGSVARCRGRSGGPIHRPDEDAYPPPSGARGRRRHRDGGPAGVEPGADPGAGAFRSRNSAQELRRDVCLCHK